MTLETHIKSLPGIFGRIPHLKRYKGFLLLNQIYFQKQIFNDLLSPKPNHQNIGYLIHENTHYRRMNEVGMIKFGSRYIFSRKYRFEEEFLAYKAQMGYLKSKRQNYDIDKTARALSSFVYFWCVPYEEAKQRLASVWNKAQFGSS